MTQEATLPIDAVRQSPLFSEAITFWFTGNGHLRSPFKPEWRQQVETTAAEKFHTWLSGLKEDARHSVNDVIVSEKLEEIIFDSAMGLATTEEERITILYPFLPRVGDPISKDGSADVDSVVTARAIVKEGQDKRMTVSAKRTANNEVWETAFELP